MSNIFISYNRHSEAIVKTLVDDIETLGHTVWFDQELKGGQTWWNQILAKVRDCEVFVFVLDPKALNSMACKSEYSYAADLGKPILPVLVAEGMSTNLLPPALSQIQFVDYRKQDRAAVLRLARALTTVPPLKPLPDPLPLPPDVPISYLGRLADQIETPSTLDYEKQSALVVDLKRSLRDPEIAEDARTLLGRLRKRRDLLATIAEEIDELLESTRKESSTPPRAPEFQLLPQKPSSETPRGQQPQGRTAPLEPERNAIQQAEEVLAESPIEAEKRPPGAQSTQRPATQLRQKITLSQRNQLCLFLLLQGAAVIIALVATWINVLSILVSGPILILIGLYIAWLSYRGSVQMGVLAGISAPTLALFCFALIYGMGWSDKDAQNPISIIASIYASIFIPLIYKVYRAEN